jgi:hypothetical protein
MLLVKKIEIPLGVGWQHFDKKFVCVPTAELCENLSVTNCGSYD